MSNTINHDREAIAQKIAYIMLKGFDKHYRLFQNISATAQERFNARQWKEISQANVDRIVMYDKRVKETSAELLQYLSDTTETDALWVQVKRIYIGLLYEHKQPELAETFYNSVACRVLARDYYHNRYIFFRPAMNTDFLKGERRTFNSYYLHQDSLEKIFTEILTKFSGRDNWHNLEADVENLLPKCSELIAAGGKMDANFQIQILSSGFYRNKGTYLVGRIINGIRMQPFVICFQHDGAGKLYVDALLTDIEHIYTLFSFTRAYFMVDMDVPSAYVDFLHEILPRRPKSELYTLLGLQKHGKTLFYRDLQHHLDHSYDNFSIAPGIRGMVMEVFVLPSFPYVFKIIKDYFEPPKDPDRQIVKDKYRLVKNHDRVGRMADTLEFTNVAFPLDRVDQELLQTLQKTCESSLEIQGRHLIIKHMYIERRMMPLNMYLATANDSERDHAIAEYGNAIKDLAAANIFPGDMLLKNFGVTKGGRVVFYDYDEICYITECKFRKMPPPSSIDDEMMDQAWYSVGANDVFPEQFSNFAFPKVEQRDIFIKLHSDLLEAKWWRERKAAIEQGHQEDFFPYPRSERFSLTQE